MGAYIFNVTPVWENGRIGLQNKYSDGPKAAEDVLACFDEGALSVNIHVSRNEEAK